MAVPGFLGYTEKTGLHALTAECCFCHPRGLQDSYGEALTPPKQSAANMESPLFVQEVSWNEMRRWTAFVA